MDLLVKDTLPESLLPFKERLSPRFHEVRGQVSDYIKEVIVPAMPKYREQHAELLKTVDHPTKCPQPPVMEELRAAAKARGLMNLFLPEVSKCTVLEYAPIAELLGMFPVANLAMNCTAPDTGNMEVLERYGSEAQKQQWLEPLLRGEIRSAYAMTEPGVASSDATNIATRIEADGNDYVINGHKWWISGAIRPECKLFVLLGRTSFSGPMHTQQSMILVPRDAPGVTILRPLAVFGEEHDHAEIIFDNVRVPKTNMVLGEGRGFEIAQGRLGPGRLHHCMRAIGTAELALAALIDRAHRRKAFGKTLAEKDAVKLFIAEARMDITKIRQLCYLTAVVADEKGFKEAQAHVAMLKVATPRTVCKIIDEVIQVHGAHGVSQDSKLSAMWMAIRELRFADGPDMVHLITIAKRELRNRNVELGRQISGTNENVAKYGKFSHVEGGALYISGGPAASKL